MGRADGTAARRNGRVLRRFARAPWARSPSIRIGKSIGCPRAISSRSALGSSAKWATSFVVRRRRANVWRLCRWIPRSASGRLQTARRSARNSPTRSRHSRRSITMHPRPEAVPIGWWSWRTLHHRNPFPRSNCHEREAKSRPDAGRCTTEFEVPGTPEEVWQAIATGPGVSSWFVPTEFEQRDGKAVAMKLNFGPGMVARSDITVWDPPRVFVNEADGWMPGLARHGERMECRGARRRHLRHSHRAEPVREHRRMGLATRCRKGRTRQFPQYPAALSHSTSAGNGSALEQFRAPTTGTEEESWEALTAALGLKGMRVGQRFTAPAGVPRVQRRGGVRHAGTVRRPAAARQAGAGCRGPRHRRLSRRADHGGD